MTQLARPAIPRRRANSPPTQEAVTPMLACMHAVIVAELTRRNAAPLMGVPLATERGLQVRAPQVATPTCDWMMRLAWRGHTCAGPDSVTMPVMPGWVTQLRIRSMVRR